MIINCALLEISKEISLNYPKCKIENPVVLFKKVDKPAW